LINKRLYEGLAVTDIYGKTNKKKQTKKVKIEKRKYLLLSLLFFLLLFPDYCCSKHCNTNAYHCRKNYQ